jgi:O-glycosyl hydrolase
MNNMWDDTSQKLHFGNKDIDSEEGTIVLIDSPKQIVSITGMVYAIGHYARWVKRGATRLEATSNNPLVQITAFWDQNQKRLILVAINNANKSQQLDILLNGVTLEGAIASEQSTQKSYWQQLSAIQVEIPNRFVISIPAKSVTTMQGLGKST